MAVCLGCGKNPKPLYSLFCDECIRKTQVGVIAIVEAVQEDIFDEAARQLGGKDGKEYHTQV